jgi:hypothetical protein
MRALCLTVLLLGGGILGAAPASSAPDSCAALGGVAQSADTCRVQASVPAYTVDITFPLGYPDERAILDYVGQTRDGFVNVAEGPERRNHPYEMVITSESLRSAQTRSVVLKLFQAAGGAHPTSWFKAFTYDTARGKPVTFDTLFAPGADPLTVIFPLVQRELESRTGLPGSISPGDGMDPSHYQNFAITDDAVIFYFARAELLPSYAGESSVKIPRSSLPPLQI